MLAHLAGCEQVNIDQPESSSGQGVLLDKEQDLVILYPMDCLKGMQQRQDFLPIRKITAGQLPNHKWVNGYLAIVQQFCEPGRSRAKVIDPHRGVDEDHQRGRRLETGRSAGSLPPSLDKRRADSRAIKL